MTTFSRRAGRIVGHTTSDANPHARYWRQCANDEPLAPRPFYRPEITFGEAAFMVVVGLAIVGGMHAVVWLVRAVQGWLG